MINPISVNKKTILERTGKNTFRWLNEVLGFNFEKPIILNCFNGNFTTKNIWSVIPHYNYDYVVCVLVKDTVNKYNTEYYAVEITENGFDIDLKSKTYFDNYKSYPETFCRKSDFDRMRRSGYCNVFIIAQDEKYTNNRKTREQCTTYGNYVFSNNDRYIIRNYQYSTRSDNTRYIYRVDITETTNNGQKKTANIPCSPKDPYTKEEEIFDHSGYYLLNRRENLKRQAKQIKANREKERYNNTDYSEQVKDVKAKTEEIKKYICSKLMNVSNYEESKIVDNMVSRFRWLMMNIDFFYQKITEKGYSSNETATKAYNNIIEKINSIIKTEEE